MRSRDLNNMGHRRVLSSVKARASRRGATIVEFVVVFGVFLTFILSFLDLGLILFRKQVLADASDRVARYAATHGSLSTPASHQLGPHAIRESASGRSHIARIASTALVTMRPERTGVSLRWPDGDNRAGERVQVTVSYANDAIFPFLWGRSSRELRETTTARILR